MSAPAEVAPATNVESESTRTYAEAFPVLRADGWVGTLPLPSGRKFPPPRGTTGWGQPDPSGADCQAWADHEYRGTSQLGLRMPATVVGIDVDHYDKKRGGDTIAEAERRWGPLPVGPWSSARADGMSGIRLFRVPAGTVLTSRIAFPELGLGDVEIIQRSHRYAVVWPSVHPETGERYTWRGTDGPTMHPRPAALPELPQAWLEGLRSNTQAGAEHRATTAEADALIRSMPPGDCPAVARRLADALADLDRGRHEAMIRQVLALLRLGEQGHRGAPAALTEFERAFVAAVAYRASEPVAMAEFERAVLGANGIGLLLADRTPEEDRGCCGPTDPPPHPDNFWYDLGEEVPQDEAIQPAVQPARQQLPDLFWEARPSLRHIRQAARAWLCSPDAVLGAALARQSAYVHPADVVVTGLGSGAPLSVFTVLLGTPGAGKGQAARCSAELLPVPPAIEDFRERPLGSGEGMVAAYCGIVPAVDAEGNVIRGQRVQKQVRTNVLFVLDEGEALLRTASRAGTTTAQALRSMWSGENVGQANASVERDRQLDRGSYAVGLIMGFQPDTIAPLFDPEQVGGGTPHRFLFMSAMDPQAPAEPPEWPGPLVQHPGHHPQVFFASPDPTRYALAPDLRRQVVAERLAGIRGERVLSPQDTHRTQYRARIAAHLAGWEGRTDVQAEDWDLAGMVLATSAAVRDAAVGHGVARERAERESRTKGFVERQTRAAVATAEAIDAHQDAQTLRVAGIVARKVRASGQADGLTRKALRGAVDSKRKALLDDALALGEQRGWIADRAGRYFPGAKSAEVPDAS